MRRRWMICGSALAFAAIDGARLPTPRVHRAESGAIAIEHVTAIPLDSERRIVDATIVVSGDSIVAVGPSTQVVVPADARRIDGHGRFAVPGFTDMHVHPYDTYAFASYLAHGVTTIAVMHGFPEVLEWRAKQRRGELDGPTIYSASPSVNGYPPGNRTFVAVQDTGTARLVAQDDKRAGYDFIKAYSFLNPDVYRALLAEAHRVGIPVVGHIPSQITYRDAITAGQVNVAHIEEFFENGDVPDDSMPVIAQNLKRAGTTVTVNLYGYIDYLRTIDDIQRVLHDPEMAFASPALLSEKLPTNNRAVNRADVRNFAGFLRGRLDRFKRLLRAFHAAGVTLLVGTDTEIFGFPGESEQLEMFAMAAEGLSPYEMLVAASANAGDLIARAVPRSEHFGRLVPGQRADIVLLSADPLADIHNINAIAGVMARGRWYSSERISAMRDSVARRTAPQRAFVERFDSLMMQAKNGRAAADAMRAFTTSNPGEVPLAEIAWSAHGRRLIAKDPVAATEILEMCAAAYPNSAATQLDLGRVFLARGDTTAALTHFERAHALSPRHFTANDMIDRTQAAQAHVAQVGTFVFDTVNATVQGRRLKIRLQVELTAEGERTVAEVQLNGDKPVLATDVVADSVRTWAYVPIGSDVLELRWTRRGDDVTGTWVSGIATNGVLRGKRVTEAKRH